MAARVIWDIDYRDLTPYLVKVLQVNRQVNGTGYFCHPDGYVLTCYHVIKNHIEQGLAEVMIMDTSGQEYTTRVVQEYCREDADLAILKITSQGGEGIPSNRPFDCLPLDVHDRWTLNDPVYGFGYPMGPFQEPGIAVNGKIGGATSHEGKEVREIYGLNLGNVQGGFSGTPVIHLRSKKVVGLVYAQSDTRQAFIVPVVKLFEHWPILKEYHDVYEHIRRHIAEEAKERLQEKLRESRFIPLGLEQGDVKKIRSGFLGPKDATQTGEWSHGREWRNSSLKELTPPLGNYVLSSSVGTGKTTFLYRFATHLIENSDRLPLFMTCADYEGLTVKKAWDDLKDHFVARYKRTFLEADLEDTFETYYKDTKVIFLFDGLDQIKGPDPRTLFANISESASSNCLIVSSRPSSAMFLEGDPRFTFLRLKPFSDDEQKLYYGELYEKAQRLAAFAPEVVRIPMLAFMVKTLVSPPPKAADIGNRADIYKEFIEYTIFGHDSQAPASADRRSMGRKVREKLGCIAFAALDQKRPQFQKIDEEACDRVMPEVPIGELASFGLVNLVAECQHHYVLFTHQSFQEFLAAFHAHAENALVDRVLEERLSAKWREVIKFLVGLRGREIIEKLLEKPDNVIHSTVFLAAECFPELRKVDEALRVQVRDRVLDLVALPPFEEDGAAALGYLDDFEQLRTMLSRKSKALREASVDTLGRVARRVPPPVVREIEGLLTDPQSEVREAALRALGHLQEQASDAVVPKIEELLTDPQPKVRRAALSALGALSEHLSHMTIQKIETLLNDPEQEVRGASAGVLYALRSKGKAISGEVDRKIEHFMQAHGPGLRSLLEIGVGFVQQVATMTDLEIEKLIRDGGQQGDFFRGVILGGFGYDRFRWSTSDTIIGAVESLLKDDKPSIRTLALEALGSVPERLSGPAVREIESLLRDPEAHVRKAALEALGHLRERASDAVVREIEGLLTDPQPEVRKAALRALKEMPDRVALVKDP